MTAWHEDNRALIAAEMERLRAALRLRVLWLRTAWAAAPGPGRAIGHAEADQLLAGPGTAAELAFRTASGADLERAAAAAEGAALAMAEAGRPAAIDVLAGTFGLSPFERGVLLLCAAPGLDPGFGRLLAYVNDDLTLPRPTPHLAANLLALGDEAAHEAFLPDAPLRRFRLVHAAEGGLDVDERVLGFLRGVNRLDPRLAGLLQPVRESPLPDSHAQLVARLHGWLAAPGQGRRALNLVGPRGAGQRAVAVALAQRLGLGLMALDPSRLPPSDEAREEMLRLAGRDLALLESIAYVDAAPGEDAARAAVEGLGAFVVVGSQEPWATARAMRVAQVGKAPAREQRALWVRALGEHPALDRLVQQFDLGPEAIAQAAAAALAGASPPTAGDLAQACRQLAGTRLDALARRLPATHAWGDIVLPDDVAAHLREVAAQVANAAQVHERWGFGALLTRGRGVSVLFTGASGTGKTMAAEVLASQLGLELYRIDLAAVVSKYIGETEKNLARLFDAAEEGGVVLFFDEADALFGRRTEVKDSHDRYANIEVDYLLQRMEEHRGLAILATNRKADLDRAFLRRLRHVIEFPLPDAGARRRIWQKAFPRAAALAPLDLDALGRLEVPGGNIRSGALNAAFLAAAEGAPIGHRHILAAMRREYQKMERPASEAEFGRLAAAAAAEPVPIPAARTVP
ncbi:MAG TPA: ATP-binding protein [Candidatus Thermoplasmatota archaeon]|nr:ATP-binding protein [Candidatus Thermoplasmatota archaeon]